MWPKAATVKIALKKKVSFKGINVYLCTTPGVFHDIYRGILSSLLPVKIGMLIEHPLNLFSFVSQNM